MRFNETFECGIFLGSIYTKQKWKQKPNKIKEPSRKDQSVSGKHPKKIFAFAFTIAQCEWALKETFWSLIKGSSFYVITVLKETFKVSLRGAAMCYFK